MDEGSKEDSGGGEAVAYQVCRVQPAEVFVGSHRAQDEDEQAEATLSNTQDWKPSRQRSAFALCRRSHYVGDVCVFGRDRSLHGSRGIQRREQVGVK